MDKPVDTASVLQRLFSLEGKKVLLTGAGGGIGSALAVALAGAGATVGVHDITLAQTDETCKLVEASGGKAVPLAANLADVDACRALIQDAHQALGSLDVLINCAGMNRRKPIEDVSLDDYELITAVNLRSIYFLCQAVHPIMQAQGGGKIINFGSLTSSMGLGGVSVYGITKAAVAQLTKTMAVEWAKDNIQVNCIAPGFMLTPLTASLWQDEYKSQWMRDRIPAGRPGQPGELAGVVLLMSSAASSYLTGQLINVDGGVLAGGSWERDQQQGL